MSTPYFSTICLAAPPPLHLKYPSCYFCEIDLRLLLKQVFDLHSLLAAVLGS